VGGPLNDVIQILPRPKPLPWQRNLRQNRLYLVFYKRYLRVTYVYQWVHRDRLSNDVNQILQRPTLVAMATKCKTKSPIARLVQEISPRCVHASNCGFSGTDDLQILRAAILVVMATKFETKSAITRFVYYEMQ